MNPFVKKILSSVGLTAVICIVALAWKGAVIYGVLYAQAPKESASVADDFYDQVKKEMGDNPNNDNLSLFQAMQKVMEQKRLEAKNKITDPNDPRDDPRLKYYFGAMQEIAPVPAVINYGGLTMKVQANELIMSTLYASPISKRQTTNLTFSLMYPQMIGKTEENFDDFYRGIPGEQKNIWLDINTEPACFDEQYVEVISDDLHEIADYFYDPDTRKRESIIRNKDCPARRILDIDYSVYGNRQEDFPNSWQKPSVYPELSEYYVTKGLKLEGYRTKGLYEKGTDIIDERVYRYIPPNAKADEYEFIACGSNPDIMPQKFSKIRFDDDLHASCTHYMLIKKRVVAQIRYSEKYFKQHWQGIRVAVLKHFDSRITKIDDYVPQFYTKHNNAYKAVSYKQLGDYIQKIQKQTAN